MSRTMRSGSHLMPQEEWEARKEAEKAARIQRFSQGAAAIERASGGLTPPSTEQSVYAADAEPVTSPPISQTQGDWLEAQFAALNQRFTE